LKSTGIEPLLKLHTFPLEFLLPFLPDGGFLYSLKTPTLDPNLGKSNSQILIEAIAKMPLRKSLPKKNQQESELGIVIQEIEITFLPPKLVFSKKSMLLFPKSSKMIKTGFEFCLDFAKLDLL